MTMITGWASLLTGAHAQRRWAAFLQIPGFSFKILNLLKFIFFLLNFPPWTANNLSHHPCAYNFDFLVFSAALHTSEFSFSQLPSFLDSLSQGYGWTVSELCLWLESWIPQNGGIQTSPCHSSCWSAWPFQGPAHEELWRFSWAGLGLLEDVWRYMLTSNCFFPELAVFCAILLTADSLGPFLLFYNMTQIQSFPNIPPPNKEVACLMFIYHWWKRAYGYPNIHPVFAVYKPTIFFISC